MARRITAFTVEVGDAQNLEIARGEDREFRLLFTQDSGDPVDMTGALACVLTVRSRTTGILVFARNYSGFVGAATAGEPRFELTQADTAAQTDGDYDVDVTWTDASGYREQLLVKSTFRILPRVGIATDPLTSPPAIPVVYGLRWRDGWSTPSGGYAVNDAVTAEDGSLGATSISSFRALTAGVTHYPINPSLLVATGWAYVGQHGGGSGGGSGGGGGAIIWTQGARTWAQILGDIQAINAQGAVAIVYLEDGGSHTPFVINTPANLDQVIFIGLASYGQQLITFAAGFTLLGTRLHLENVAATTQTTIWTYDAGQPARIIDWRLRMSTLQRGDGAAPGAILGGASNFVVLEQSSIILGSYNDGTGFFSMQQNAGLIEWTYNQSLIDGSVMELAGGATAATWFCALDPTCSQLFGDHPLDAAITFQPYIAGNVGAMNDFDVAWDGVESWIQLRARINSRVASHGRARLLLPNGFLLTMNSPIDLDNVEIIGAPSGGAIDWSGAFALLGTGKLRLTNITLAPRTNAAVYTGATIDWVLDNSNIAMNDISYAVPFQITGSGDIVLRNGSLVWGLETIFGVALRSVIQLTDAQQLNVIARDTDSSLRPSAVVLASGAAAIVYSLDSLAQSLADAQAITPSAAWVAGITAVYSAASDATKEGYVATADPDWPEGSPTRVSTALDILAARDGSAPGLPVVYLQGSQQHITHGNYWTQGQTMVNAMRWEAWAMGDPWGSGQYLIADGYGGGHALLWSGLNGNIIFNQGVAGEAIISFTADDIPPAGIFSCVDVRIQLDPYAKPVIIMRTNGIPVGRAFITAGISRSGAGAGGGPLYVGGSDHNNFIGWVAYIRGWDDSTASDIYPGQCYIPQRWFTCEGPSGEPVTFLCSYISDHLAVYPDISAGYDGQGAYTKRTHPGVPYRGLDYGNNYFFPPASPTLLPRIERVLNAPFDQDYDQNDSVLITALGRGYTPKAVPASAKLFDSFSRHDQEFAHLAVPDLGSVEYCSFAAAPRWKTDSVSGVASSLPTPYNPDGTPVGGEVQKAAIGIFNRSPISLDQNPNIAWVDGNSANMTVKVARRPSAGTSSDGGCAIAFRVQDGQHFWMFIYSRIQNGEGTFVDDNLYLYRWDGADPLGVLIAGGYAVPGPQTNFAEMSVVTSGNLISCRLDGVEVFNFTDATYNTAVGAGIFFPVQGALGRRYDFTVL